MFMVSETWREFLTHAEAHVRSGRIPMARIDDAVRRVLRVKTALGLFDKPRPAARKWSNANVVGCAEHRAIAREAVRKSIVLLKNEGAALPLAPDARILVAGRNAHDIGHQCGGFSIAWQGSTGNEVVEGGTSIWDGIAARAPHARLSVDGSGREADPARHDIAVVVIGETPYAEGLGDIRTGDDVAIREGSMIRGKLKILAPYGHSTALSALHPEDAATIERIRATGVPVVTVMVCGRPLETNREIDASDAFAVAWLPGSEGDGVAEVLFGEAPFSGRLPFAWPATTEPPHFLGDDRQDARFARGYGLDA